MAIELRRLTENELELLMNWRMREDISKMMFNNVNLTMEGQLKWFEKIKNSETEIRWIIWKDNTPIGSMYFVDIDKKNLRCESGWFIAEKNGMDFSQVIALQRNSFDYAFDVLGLNRVYGMVIDVNKGLPRMLELCGVRKEGVLKQHVIKDGKPHDVIVVGITKEDWYNQKKTIDYEKMYIE